MKIYSCDKHLLRLIAKEQDNPEGWAKVSPVIYPLVDSLPKELVELRPSTDGWGIAQLTEEGKSMVKAMAWL